MGSYHGDTPKRRANANLPVNRQWRQPFCTCTRAIPRARAVLSASSTPSFACDELSEITCGILFTRRRTKSTRSNFKTAIDQDGYCCGRGTGPFQRIRSPPALPCFVNRPGVVCVSLGLLFPGHSPPWCPVRRPAVHHQVPRCVPALRGGPGESDGAHG